MRPVDRGSSPRRYTRYQDAGPDLQTRLGDYCSYCERQIETNLAIEHVQPKSRKASLRNEWSNFLLGCCNCNSCKGDTPIVAEDYLWPDLDNTLLAIEYTEAGRVSPSPSVRFEIQMLAQATIELVGLDREPGHPDIDKQPTPADRRWLRRYELWRLAMKDRARLVKQDTPEVRELIVENAVARGMFSIWWTVFVGDEDMRRRFRLAFPNTTSSCFDAKENVVPRPGGQT